MHTYNRARAFSSARSQQRQPGLQGACKLACLAEIDGEGIFGPTGDTRTETRTRQRGAKIMVFNQLAVLLASSPSSLRL